MQAKTWLKWIHFYQHQPKIGPFIATIPIVELQSVDV
jgi:hypothetical protein